MRRIVLLVLAAFAVMAGVVQVAPSSAPIPAFEAGNAEQVDGAEANPTAWYCPWIAAGDVFDSAISVATVSDAVVDLTLLDPLTNAEPTVSTFDLVAPGATGVETGNLLRKGESPAIVEISDGPAAAASMQWADALISADKCTVSVPDEWYLPGGSTKTGTFTQLRLFNPFADNAEVEITAHSEFNLDLIPDLAKIDVAGRSWTTIDFEPFLPFRDELSIKVTSTTGLVIPVMIRTDDHGEATWNGSSPSQTWEFPVASPGKLQPSLAIVSAGEDDVTVTIDVVTEQGMIIDAREITLDSTAPALVPLEDIAAAPFGVRVSATAPVVATVVAIVSEEPVDQGEGSLEDEPTSTTVDGTDTTAVSEEDFVRGLAATTGIPEPATSWIVPLDTLPGSETTMWIMNSGLEPATVEVLSLGEGEFLAEETVQVLPGSVLPIPVASGIGTFGFHLTSDQPISAAWELVGDRGVALVAGIPAG